jgi:hypothetical protein
VRRVISANALTRVIAPCGRGDRVIVRFAHGGGVIRRHLPTSDFSSRLDYRSSSAAARWNNACSLLAMTSKIGTQMVGRRGKEFGLPTLEATARGYQLLGFPLSCRADEPRR